MGDSQYEGIAIIGMAGRFPGAESIEEFWANLLAARESISFFSDAELVEAGFDPASLKSRGNYIAARGVLKDADCFDAAFFSVHPKEAEAMDPQHRVFLEACWAALERAGYPPDQAPGTVGVFAGATFNTYYRHALQPRPDLLELVGADQAMFGNEKDYLATRVAYKLGLKGPALNISTACSTSLVAVCQACQALLTYQCDMALAGGVSVTVPQQRGYYHDDGNIGSADGHTRTFDAQASGTVFSNGVAVVVLKRLEEAVNDGDRIYAVIKGAALNNDGSQRVSFGAPGVEGQSRVVAMAHALAGVEPETITCVEAHGTATPLGDPIEVTALTKAFRLGTDAKQFCALGSLKSNIGHLDAAAGVTGLIKTALSLHHKILTPHLHFQTPNPKLDLANSPFYVNTALQEWRPASGAPRRAGVSSFGTGGTNAHVVLEEAPDLPNSEASRPWQLLVLSAKSEEALDRATSDLCRHLKETGVSTDPEKANRELADTAFTLQTGRSEFVHRRFVTCENALDGVTALESRDPKHVFTHRQQLKNPPIVFLFPGQGAQYAGMGAELYQSEPAFRAEVDRCARLLEPLIQMDLRTVLFPEPDSQEESDRLLVQTRFTQPALFVIEYALAKLWMSWGIQPSAMIGHSVGEYVAGCLSGVFTLEDALLLVARRAALVQAQPGGAMLAVRLPEKDVLPLLKPGLAIAAINSPNLCVVSGPFELIAGIEEELRARNVAVRRLHTSHAFHSPMMDPVLAPFTELLRSVQLREPQIPYVSNVTARWIAPEEAQSPEYWAGHVRQAVRFADGVAELMKDSRNVLLEVGPGQTLTTLARQHPAKSAAQPVLSSLQSNTSENRGILEALGRLWMVGVSVDWPGFYANEQRRRTVLPTYPFERTRYWPEAPQAAPITATTAENVQAPKQLAAVAAPAEPAESAIPRKERLLAASRSLIEELSGYDLSAADGTTDLLEMGLDSLLLTQAALLFQRKFGVAISFRQLMEELNSLDAIASHLDKTLPPDAFAPVTPTPAPHPVSTINATSTAVPGNNILEQLLQQQQQLTNQLLQLLNRQPAASPALQPAKAPVAATPLPEQKSHGPFKPIQRGADTTLSSEQHAALDALISRYTRRTAGSKKLAAENRSVLADPRSVSGFKQLWKEMVYPIYTTRSDGSRVWDVDGNEYVDFVMGFGASLFGHRPPFVVQAVHEQLDRGFEIGPIQPLAGEVAALIREFTGMQRIGFTNTGSEAVLAATRVCRTVTGRDKIAVFSGAYHGIFDEVLFRPLTVNGEIRTAPIAPGIPGSALEQVIVLDWANPRSLEILRARGAEIAAVLVEPVQSRRLDVQPKEFLRELRQITQDIGAALIFDEVVTGFRVHPGGAQSYFGVRADLATYGKVIGGGISIGVVAGDPKYLDALDGGQWSYGDTSFPEVGVTFFAGTFVRHPLALAAAKAVLTHLKQSGPTLQENLAERTAETANRLRGVIGEFGAPYEVTQFSSLIQVGFPADQKLAGLLFYMLRDRGIHTYENRAFVMTTSHTDDDIGRLTRAFHDSLKEMRDAGFLPASAARAKQPAASIMPAETPAGSQEQIGEPFPLTEAQKEIWLAAQMGGAAALGYNESLKFDFRGAFDVDLFRAAIRRILQRHPILLATFSRDGQSQQIHPGATVDVPLVDLSVEDDSIQRRKLAEIVEEAISTPFDLTTGPLLRIDIIRLSGEHHVVIWTAHHIVCDGWSAGLLVNELAKIYSASKQGTTPVLDIPSSFREYALATLDENDEMAYWRGQFSELPAPLDLPSDHPRPLVRSGRASTMRRELPQSLHQQLKRVAGQQRTTLVVILIAGLKVLLHRLSGQSDIVIGLGAAGQALSGRNCLAGHCVNLLPIRTRLNKEAGFQENLAAIKKTVLDAYDHHGTTLGGILQNLRVPRSTARPPLVEIIFNVDRDPGADGFHGLSVKCERNPKRALHFDLFFNFVEGPHGLCVECDYNTDLFDSATIDRWLGHFETLLGGIAANPAKGLGELPLLTEAESHELAHCWNDSAKRFPRQWTLAEWFESQAEKTPHARAVTYQGLHITYQELNLRANRLAHYLRGQGVGPDTLVGLFVERSPELVVGILGILKAGGAYLPIDPVYPSERIAFMIEDAGVPLVLTESSLAPTLRGLQTKIVSLDADHAVIIREPDTNPPKCSHPDNLAYVIYTSGSTGKPKGTLITQHNVVRLMQATEHWYRFNERDVWTLFHSHAFDFSVWELWGALLYGGRLVVVPYLTSRSPEEFYHLLANEQVTVLNQTPSAFKQLIQAEGSLSPRPNLALRYVIFGGEALDISSLQPWFERHGDRNPTLVNMYGITETTVHVTYRPLSKTDLTSGSVIGVPIPDLQVYILDAHRQPVPIGVFGEIYVGGDGVARGYLKRDHLTRERFLPDTFSNRPGNLLYRSGDLARRLPNGDIEYGGRIDTQVKIRGFRIELREIETVLERHPSIAQCAVVARAEASGDKRIVAYVTASTQPPSAGDLRSYLKHELPDYMIPSAFVLLQSLPLTANGKIDYRALPAPEADQMESGDEFIAPRDPLEQGLAQLWSKILKVRRVGLSSNFFDLGGHSLLAVRLVLEIEKLYKKRLPLATFLQAPTLGQLAEKLREDSCSPVWPSLVPLRPGGSKPPLFLMHSHGGNVLEYHPLAERLDSDQPVYALQARGLDGRIVKDPSIEEMAAAYLEEIRSLQPQGPYFLGGFCFGGLLALEAAQQLVAAGEEVALVAILQTIHPAFAQFKPETSPVQRSWYRTVKRLQLEQENFLNRGPGYLFERSRRVWNFGRARIALTLTGLPETRDKLPLEYILEALGAEHDKAFDKYCPQPYGGNAVLFRSATQLRGLLAESTLGWKNTLIGDLKICEVPGHQQNMLVEPNVSYLAEELSASLTAAQQRYKLVESR